MSVRSVMLLLVVCVACAPARSQEVWSTETISFTKQNFADWTTPEAQDRITDLVWITRRDTMPIFNIAQEAAPTGSCFATPRDTQWAFGRAADWQELQFAALFEVNTCLPFTMLNQPMVVHLVSEDIYIDITFTDWTSGAGGGGFSYMRAEPAVSACDWDTTGIVNSDDFFAFLDDFFAGNADFNNTGSIDSDDFFGFLDCFFAA